MCSFLLEESPCGRKSCLSFVSALYLSSAFNSGENEARLVALLLPLLQVSVFSESEASVRRTVMRAP